MTKLHLTIGCSRRSGKQKYNCNRMDNKNQTTTLKIKTTSTKTAITIITNTAIMKTIKRTMKRNLKKLGKPPRTTIPKKKLTMVTRMRQLTQLTRLTSMKTIKKTRM